jgi:hypothetical protein
MRLGFTPFTGYKFASLRYLTSDFAWKRFQAVHSFAVGGSASGALLADRYQANP